MPAPDSSTGFAPADWALFFLASCLVLATLTWRPRIQTWLDMMAGRRWVCLWFFFLIPIVLRLLLLPHHPVPVPDIYDEFSHLLLADTLLHGRLANPPHALPQFFETFFVLQRPTYSSIYPLGMGLVLAFGRLISGVPWTGVLLLSGLLCASCHWMLRGWLNPRWSFLGAILAVIQFGPLCQWTNCYWGGSLAAAGGCLVFGALPRLRRQPGWRDAALLGLGFGFHMFSRQFESVFLLVAVVLFFFLCGTPAGMAKQAVPALLAVLPFAALILMQNRAVTGSWTTLPEQLSRYQYGVPSALTFENNPVPHVPLTPQQDLDYRAQAMMHGSEGDSPLKFLLRLEYRVRLYRFFFLPPLYLALIAFLPTLRNAEMRWMAATLAIFALGINLFPYMLDHYLAAVTCLFVLISLLGLQQISRIRIRHMAVGHEVVMVLLVLCFAEFGGWYSLHLFERPALYPILRFETWDAINHDDSNGRLEVARKLAEIKGRLLVFVRYSQGHIYQHEWVWNQADIDGSRIVFARDLGTAENLKLMRYFSSRQVFFLDPDGSSPKISSSEEAGP